MHKHLTRVVFIERWPLYTGGHYYRFHCTLVSVKYNKTLKTLPLYAVLDESLVTNIALGFTSCYIYHSTLILSCIVYHINWRQYFK